MKDYIPNMVRINMLTIFVFFAFCIGACAGGNNSLPESSNDDVLSGIVNPFNSSCYDWRGDNIPCDFKRQYAELLLDEIQTGLGRTGKLLAEEHEGIQSDLTVIGKALSGGFYPVSAVLSTEAVLGVLNPGQHGSTFGGNPLACAIARKALQVLMEEEMIENSARMGEYFLSELKKINSPVIKEIRGKGLMIAIELKKELQITARQICERLSEKGILCKDTHSYTIRFTPPLIIKKDEVDFAVNKIKAALSD